MMEMMENDENDENHENCENIMKVMEDDETKKIFSIALIKINWWKEEFRIRLRACSALKKAGGRGGAQPHPRGGVRGGGAPPHSLLLLILLSSLLN